jgi:hypothetical protein
VLLIIQYWNEKTNSITLLSSVSLFLLKETNIHTISVLIYHGMRNATRAAGAMPRRQTHMRVRDARVSVLYILAHTVYVYYLLLRSVVTRYLKQRMYLLISSCSDIFLLLFP